MKTIASELGITPPVVTRHIQMGAAKLYKIAKILYVNIEFWLGSKCWGNIKLWFSGVSVGD